MGGHACAPGLSDGFRKISPECPRGPGGGELVDRAAVLSNAAFLQRATNRVLRLRLVNFLRFQDEKIIEFREFSDTFDTVEQALGRWIEV